MEFSASSLPGPENVSFPMDSSVPESPRFTPENRTVMQRSDNNNKTPEQGKTIAQVSKTQSSNSAKADLAS